MKEPLQLIGGLILLAYGLMACNWADAWSEGSKEIGHWIPDSTYVPIPDLPDVIFFLITGVISSALGVFLLCSVFIAWRKLKSEETSNELEGS